MIHLRSIRHLLAVASYPTVQAAADAIHLTQPALTQSIARFEDELGAKLFDRRGRKLELTEFGARMVSRSEELMRHVRDLEEDVALWNGLGTGEANLGVDPEAELRVLPDVLAKFVTAHPAIQVTIRSGQTDNLLPALLRGDLHFLVADAEILEDRDDLDIQALSPEPIAAALRPGHPLARVRKPEPADLETYPLAGASTAPRFDRWKAERGRRDNARPLEPSLICDNYEVLVRLAETSDTIVFGPRGLLQSYERTGRLKLPSWPVEGPAIQSSLIRSKGRYLSPAAAQLMTLFAEQT